MTRKEALRVLYEIINSGIINEELCESLEEVCNCICGGDFKKCEVDKCCKSGAPNYCEGCEFLNEEE